MTDISTNTTTYVCIYEEWWSWPFTTNVNNASIHEAYYYSHSSDGHYGQSH